MTWLVLLVWGGSVAALCAAFSLPAYLVAARRPAPPLKERAAVLIHTLGGVYILLCGLLGVGALVYGIRLFDRHDLGPVWNGVVALLVMVMLAASATIHFREPRLLLGWCLGGLLSSVVLVSLGEDAIAFFARLVGVDTSGGLFTAAFLLALFGFIYGPFSPLLWLGWLWWAAARQSAPVAEAEAPGAAGKPAG